MKRLFALSFLVLCSLVGFAQSSTTREEQPTKNYSKKYFISSNSGIYNTPVGFRVGILDRRGGYIAARFGSGEKYKRDFSNINNKLYTHEKAVMISTTVGLILPLYIGDNFRVHTYMGIGYGQWFQRAPKNGVTLGGEMETGLVFSYTKLMVTTGGSMLLGDGNSPIGDFTLGIGYRFL